MNIDIAALRMIEADKGISIETVITATERRLNYHDTNARFSHIGARA